jgi:hypothetical protein
VSHGYFRKSLKNKVSFYILRNFKIVRIRRIFQ